MSKLTYEFLFQEYITKKKSCRRIAEENNTYANKIHRTLRSYGIPTRNNSESQSAAIKNNRHHPTKGKKTDPSVKLKISNSLSESYSKLNEEEKQRRSDIAKKNWLALSEEEREEIFRKAHKAIQKASVYGSKLERFLLVNLKSKGYAVEFHQQRIIEKEELEIDLLIPELKTAIEIDGPTHFLPIWGEERLQKIVERDNAKNGLLIQSGYKIVRVKCLVKHISAKKQRDILQNLINVLQSIESGQVKESLIEIEVI